MSKLFLLGVLFISLTGCSTIQKTATKVSGKSAEELHDIAVIKVSDYIEKVVVKKVDENPNLSEAGKSKLKLEITKIKGDILVKIEELHVKYVEAKTAGSESK